MVNRRSAVKIILVFVAAVVSYVFLFRWLPNFSAPNLARLKKKTDLIAEIAEVIIPRTDTPGAKDARVEKFIIQMVKFCSDEKTQLNFLKGIDKLEEYSMNVYKRPFISCTDAEKQSVLTYFENNSTYRYNILNKINNKLLGKPFIVKFKELTVEGYCTSRLGATEGLAYDPIPISFKACIPLYQNQLAWATK